MDKMREKFIFISTQEKRLDEIYHAIAKKLGLSDSSFWVLYGLSEAEEPITQSFLTERLGIPKQTINTAINNLVKEGFLYLEQLPVAGNNKAVVLTQKGRDFCQKNIMSVLATEDKAYANISQSELEEFIRLYELQNKLLREYLGKYAENVK